MSTKQDDLPKHSGVFLSDTKSLVGIPGLVVRGSTLLLGPPARRSVVPSVCVPEASWPRACSGMPFIMSRKQNEGKERWWQRSCTGCLFRKFLEAVI